MTVVKTPQQIRQLEDSFRTVSQQGEAFVDRFYEKFFGAVPEAKDFFDLSDMFGMRAKLLVTLTMVIRNLHEAEILKGLLEDLGDRHLHKYTIPNDMFPRMKQPLLDALGESIGQEWTPDLEATWGEAYDNIVRLMIGG